MRDYPYFYFYLVDDDYEDYTEKEQVWEEGRDGFKFIADHGAFGLLSNIYTELLKK